MCVFHSLIAAQPAEDEARCTHANTLKGHLALTGNTSSLKCQSFLLGLGFDAILLSQLISFWRIKYPYFTEQKPVSSQHLSMELECEPELILK